LNCNWKEFRLGDLTTWASGSTPSKQNPSFWGGKIPWISGTVMRSKNLSESNQYLTQEGFENKGKLCKKNSILLLVRGDLFKRIPVGIATKSLCFNQDIKAINSVSDNLLQHFIYYLLEGNKKKLSNIVEFTGLGAGKLDTQLLQNLTFKIPPINYQKNLINFFDSIDSKIELNRESNKNLEKIAQALFKSWFIDFDLVKAKSEGRSTGLTDDISNLFPDSFENSIFGEIPQTWKVSKFGKLCTPKRGKVITKKTIIPGEIPVVAGGISPAYYHSKSNASSPVVTISASGNAGYVNLFYKDIWASDCSYINKNVTDFIYFSHSFLKANQNKIFHLRHGAVQQHINPKDLMGLDFLLPPVNLINIYEQIVTLLHNKISNNLDEINTLSSMREILLPKLISGELGIPDVEKMINEVGI
tara:strand:- start:68 stop:1315 length:1248 start_codon:yes stop_codon:yes gene_type:complete